jgi:hypothetical protein
MMMPISSKSQDVHHNNGQPSAEGAIQAETHVVDDATHRTTNAMLQRGRAAAEVTLQGTQAGTETMRRASEAATETVRRTTQVVAEGQRQIAQDAAQTFQAMSRKMAQAAQSTSEDIRQLSTLPHAAEGGMHDVRQGITGLIEGVMQTNLRATQELIRLTNPSAMVELQQRYVRNYMDAVMQGTVTLVRAVRRTADETLQPLEAQIEQRQQAR